MFPVCCFLCVLLGQYCRIDGGVDSNTRQRHIERFNSEPDSWLFLLSTRAGGQGINLTAADTVVLLAIHWGLFGLFGL